MSRGQTVSPEVALFFNEHGAINIDVGVTAFECMGVLPPDDHPHVYLNMADGVEILCPYCSTQYRFKRGLRWNETDPPDCFWAESHSQTRIIGDGPTGGHA